MNRIKKIREEKNMTQQELADKIGCAKSSIATYENETRKPSLEVLVKLSEILNVSIDYLLCKSDNKEMHEDILDEMMIGMSRNEYESLTENQKEQLRIFAKLLKSNDKKED